MACKAHGIMYEVIIVPSAAAGSAVFKRTFPQIASFYLPDKIADEKIISRLPVNNGDTYLSVTKEALNTSLQAFGAKVHDLSQSLFFYLEALLFSERIPITACHLWVHSTAANHQGFRGEKRFGISI
jgi:hypothetical protein